MHDQRSAGRSSPKFDYDGRQVTVYIPAVRRGSRVGDGQLISQWGGVLEAADVPSTMIVGVHRLADETLRLHEYSPGFDPERFAAHEEFFVGDVRRWARSRLESRCPPIAPRCLGVSAGGELALAIWACGIRTSSVPSSAPRRARVTGRLRRCHAARFRARTWSRARWSRSSCENATRWAVGACAMQVRTS